MAQIVKLFQFFFGAIFKICFEIAGFWYKKVRTHCCQIFPIFGAKFKYYFETVFFHQKQFFLAHSSKLILKLRIFGTKSYQIFQILARNSKFVLKLFKKYYFWREIQI